MFTLWQSHPRGWSPQPPQTLTGRQLRSCSARQAFLDPTSLWPWCRLEAEQHCQCWCGVLRLRPLARDQVHHRPCTGRWRPWPWTRAGVGVQLLSLLKKRSVDGSWRGRQGNQQGHQSLQQPHCKLQSLKHLADLDGLCTSPSSPSRQRCQDEVHSSPAGRAWRVQAQPEWLSVHLFLPLCKGHVVVPCRSVCTRPSPATLLAPATWTSVKYLEMAVFFTSTHN